jgi:hypothetical protein
MLACHGICIGQEDPASSHRIVRTRRWAALGFATSVNQLESRDNPEVYKGACTGTAGSNSSSLRSTEQQYPSSFTTMVLKLYGYFASTCTERVVVVLHEKKVNLHLILIL